MSITSYLNTILSGMDSNTPAANATQPPTIEELRRRATITVPMAGAVLNLGRDASYAAAKRGEIPTLRLGRRVVVPTQALLRLLGVVTDQ